MQPQPTPQQQRLVWRFLWAAFQCGVVVQYLILRKSTHSLSEPVAKGNTPQKKVIAHHIGALADRSGEAHRRAGAGHPRGECGGGREVPHRLPVRGRRGLRLWARGERFPTGGLRGHRNAERERHAGTRTPLAGAGGGKRRAEKAGRNPRGEAGVGHRRATESSRQGAKLAARK